MKRFERYLEGLAEQYVASVREKKREGKEMAIYGAGKIGASLCRFLQGNGISVDSFCVTEEKGNPEKIFGVPVHGIGNLAPRSENICFLIGVGRSTQQAVTATLEQHGAQDFLMLPDGMTALLDERYRRPLIQVTPKTGCSVRCHYCPQDLFMKRFFAKPRQGMMSLEDYKRCLDKTPQDTVIEFAGFVEPFLNPEAAEMMLYTASTGREVNLFTTLAGMTWETWEKIKGIPFTIVVLHLPDAKGYANIPMTEEYWKLLRAVIYAKKPDGRSFVDKANSQSAIHPDVLRLVDGKVHIDATQLVDRAGNLESEELQSGGVPHGPLLCPTAAKLDHNILLADGSLVLCCMDFGMQHVLGNLLEESYEEIMQGEAMKQIVEKMCADESEDLLCRTCVRAVSMRENVCDWEDRK